jgi:hypothetical protein
VTDKGRASWRPRAGQVLVVVLVLGGVVMLTLPNLISWWKSGELCPSTVMNHGRTPRGIDWTITRSDCGDAVGEVWQVRLIAPGGVSQPVYDARGWPQAQSVEQVDENAVRIRLDRSPDDGAPPEVVVQIDSKARPANAARFLAGHRLN